VSNRFFLFLLLGFALILVGIAVILVASVLYGSGSANFGAVIIVGPFPIVIGVGSEAALMVLFSVILAVLSVIMFIVLRRRNRCAGG
jgi:uncharacterized membrane protein